MSKAQVNQENGGGDQRLEIPSAGGFARQRSGWSAAGRGAGGRHATANVGNSSNLLEDGKLTLDERVALIAGGGEQADKTKMKNDNTLPTVIENNEE